MPSTDPRVMTMHLPYSPNVVAGSYTGQLKVALCADAACKSPYAGYEGSVAYSINVTPALRLAVPVNGVDAGGSYIRVNEGDQVNVASSLSGASWTVLNAMNVLVTPATTDTTWIAAPRGSGSFTLSARVLGQHADAQFLVTGR
jgi:hypothetical protein